MIFDVFCNVNFKQYMIMKNKVFIILFMSMCLFAKASHKVYLVHGYAGLGIELEKINRTVQKAGFISEIYYYPSLTEDVDKAGKELMLKIKQENYDSVSFVTHSLGALVVRSIYHHLDSTVHFPYIHRFVMIAPPNNGSPIADFWAQFGFVKHLVGPNVDNLTTNPITGAQKYPKPKCEVGIIAGSTGRKVGYNIFIVGDNDGLVPVESAKLGTEQDITLVNSSHVSLVMNKKVVNNVVNFLEYGKFLIELKHNSL